MMLFGTDEIYFSSRWKEILGYCDSEIPNAFSTWQDRVHPDDLATALSDIEDNLSAKTDYYENIHRLKHKDGSWVWIHDRGKTIFNERGKAIRMIGTHTDITDAKEMEIKFLQQSKIIEENHNYLQSIVDSVYDPIMVI